MHLNPRRHENKSKNVGASPSRQLLARDLRVVIVPGHRAAYPPPLAGFVDFLEPPPCAAVHRSFGGVTHNCRNYRHPGGRSGVFMVGMADGALFPGSAPGTAGHAKRVPVFLGAFSGALGSPCYLIMLFAPLARLFARKRLWLADGAAAVLAALFSLTFYQSVWQDLVNGCCTVLFNLVLLWLLRRFGLLAHLSS